MNLFIIRKITILIFAGSWNRFCYICFTIATVKKKKLKKNGRKAIRKNRDVGNFVF